MRKRRRTSAFKRLGLVLVWLGAIALLIPAAEGWIRPSMILLPLGVTLYTIGWIRD
ncbi:MAG: hypothetical protein LAT62_08360 [Natronospirillum sp.]|uniref:hypothetical protein n=1 Tax=Natronospirillum sp. TaxID=2812955 RepID=UPI0025EF7BC7|nr:hypothetical protein [Natronospirillum sp.]MCH8551935.1 hypothetical protein [Natronospirillum sp.]